MAILVHTKTGIPQFAGTCVSKTTPPPNSEAYNFFRGDLVRASNLHSTGEHYGNACTPPNSESYNF